MGEPVTVIERRSSRKGFVRFETNRTFTGMGHESYRQGDQIFKHRPPDELARTLLATGQVVSVHIYSQMVTVELAANASPNGLKEAIENHYTHYLPGVEVPTADSFQ